MLAHVLPTTQVSSGEAWEPKVSLDQQRQSMSTLLLTFLRLSLHLQRIMHLRLFASLAVIDPETPHAQSLQQLSEAIAKHC